jgi:predicted short-subunit dehydrogenase-like oxidoreductase (DUF2520 family)
MSGMPEARRPVVVGRGRLGRSLAAALSCQLLEGHGATIVPANCLCLIAVPDPVISSTAARLDGDGAAFVHLSASYGLELLEHPARRGHPVGSMHPLQSFPDVRDKSAFSSTFFAIDASDQSLLEELTRLAGELGGWAMRITGEDRLIYAAGANMAGPLLVALVSQAVRCLERAGIERDQALDALIPYVSGTIRNLATYRLPGALIGPIRRADAATVQSHLRTLEPPTRDAYRLLSRAALELALDAGLTEEAAAPLRLVLDGTP